MGTRSPISRYRQRAYPPLGGKENPLPEGLFLFSLRYLIPSLCNKSIQTFKLFPPPPCSLIACPHASARSRKLLTLDSSRKLQDARLQSHWANFSPGRAGCQWREVKNEKRDLGRRRKRGPRSRIPSTFRHSSASKSSKEAEWQKRHLIRARSRSLARTRAHKGEGN